MRNQTSDILLPAQRVPVFSRDADSLRVWGQNQRVWESSQWKQASPFSSQHTIPDKGRGVLYASTTAPNRPWRTWSLLLPFSCPSHSRLNIRAETCQMSSVTRAHQAKQRMGRMVSRSRT